MAHVAILHGSNDLYGASAVLLDEVAALSALGHSISVLVPTSGPLNEKLAELGVQVIVETRLAVLRKSRIRDTIRPLSLPSSARNADLVILWTLALVPYVPWLRTSKKPFYLAVHELLRGRLGAVLLRALIRPGMFPLTACSEAVKSWLVAEGVEESRVTVTYPIISFHDLREHSTQRRNTILVLARVNGNKGHLDVARAFTRTAPPGARLILAGAPYPGQEAALESLLAEIEDDSRISYVGEVDGFEGLAAETDLVACFPRTPEPFGLVPVEAWSMGVRSMGFDDGGASEVLRLVGGYPVARTQDPVTDIETAIRDWFEQRVLTEPPPPAAQVLHALSADARREKIRSVVARAIQSKERE